MLRGIRTKLAAWLDPDMARNEMRYLRLMVQIQAAHRWLAEQPVSNAVTEWLMHNDASFWRKEGQPAPKAFAKWRSDISDFREQLRRGEHLPKPEPDKTTAEEARANVERVDFSKQRANLEREAEAYAPRGPYQTGDWVPGDNPEQDK